MKRRTCLQTLASAAALATASAWATAAAARPSDDDRVPPGPTDLGTLTLRGQGTMRFLGFAVYDARLWADVDWEPRRYAQARLALELHYRRAFSAQAIAQRSIEEMRRIAPLPEDLAPRWQAALQAALPDVGAGDRLLGVHRPGQGAEFWRGAQRVGRVDDTEFSRLFFGIWLAPQTSAPALRDALLARTRESP